MSETDRARVAAVERRILAAEGPHHVGGIYYANADDADRQRRWAAERAVREEARRDEWARRSAAAPPVRVATWLLPAERDRVSAACGAHLALTHCDELPKVRAALAAGRADAALVSVALVRPITAAPLTALARAFPACVVVGLVADTDEAHALSGALLLGRAGGSAVVDTRTPPGWAALRRAFEPTRLPDAFQRRALDAVMTDLRAATTCPARVSEPATAAAPADAGEVSDGCLRFFRLVFAPDVPTAKRLAARLGVHPTTLTSRFYRAGLPSPKRYLAVARLAWAAHLAEAPGVSLAAVAGRLDASSPQSFGRTVRTTLGMTARQFRQAYDGAAMLERFRDLLVRPYRDTLRAFDPLALGPVMPRPARVAGHIEQAPPTAHDAAHLPGRAA
jgi:AraC-like DNA-binding protein